MGALGDAHAKGSHVLCERTYGAEEANAMIDVILSGKLTMGDNVRAFENEFASKVGAKYAVMVNSGSSANLLAMAVLANFRFEGHLRRGAKVIVPAVCWSTSVWPIVQMGLEPVFVDVEVDTLNANMDAVERLVQSDPTIRAVVAVHILGNSTDMTRLMAA